MHLFWLLLLAVHIIYSDSFSTTAKIYHEERMYGDPLSINLPTWATKLQFTSVDEKVQDVLWSKFQTTKWALVTGREDGKRFVIRSVTFDDQGTYTVLNQWNKKMSIHLLKVIIKRSSQDCLAGETFKIPLGPLVKNDATLYFSNRDYNITLVDHGSPVGNSHFNNTGHIQVTSQSIEVLSVNVSDVGNYTLSDRLNRKVKIITMKLVDHHKGIPAGPLTGLLLLFGLPPCMCCCWCCTKICKKSSQSDTTAMKSDNQVTPPEPPPAYGSPSALAAPTVGFGPVIYNAAAGPDPVKGEITSTTPLLMPPQPEVAQPPAPIS